MPFEIVLFWVIGAFVVAIIAGSRERNVIGWLVLSLFISPLFGLILVLALPGRNAVMDPRFVASQPRATSAIDEPSKVCPRCAERVKLAAKVCRYCNNEFTT